MPLRYFFLIYAVGFFIVHRVDVTAAVSVV